MDTISLSGLTKNSIFKKSQEVSSISDSCSGSSSVSAGGESTFRVVVPKQITLIRPVMKKQSTLKFSTQGDAENKSGIFATLLSYGQKLSETIAKPGQVQKKPTSTTLPQKIKSRNPNNPNQYHTRHEADSNCSTYKNSLFKPIQLKKQYSTLNSKLSVSYDSNPLLVD